ncbi:LysR family transcriptional regulator [Curvibacter sp. HBC28]|uniref:LysR family transcriptional regulator n=1 Tax=Curvibacter microcysteis TaxID=3026419 RepID=A0ABT5MDJ8_9BURK|nr:LysR family transcriptional regulator [Curvibacter sp. HBC28]MDD0813196.1 LysR family transcriptional regulator [Curvibacter sp. HBC28]
MDEQDPFSGVALFVAAARAGNFTKAGDQLGLTKSAVGKAITRLETRLGFKLFHRTTRLTRLTSDGETYLAACLAALDEVTAAQTALSSSHQVLSGRLHIDMPVAFGRSVLLPALMEILQAHPGISLTLSFTDATSDLLREDVDLAIRFGRLADSTHLVARRLAQQRRVICASPAYLKRRGVPTSLAELAEHRCIVGTPNGPPLAWSVCTGNEPTLYTPHATHQFSDGAAMVDAAIFGLGLVQLPISLLREALASGQLQEVLPEVAGPDVEIHAVWPRRPMSPRLRYVVDQLLACAAAGRFD